MSPKIRLSLDVSPEMNTILNNMAEKIHTSKSEVLKKSIALMIVAVQEKENGNHLGVINKEQKVIKEIIGL